MKKPCAATCPILGLKDYRILESEHGVIPMTDHPFPRRLGKRILAIGTRGGRVKPSTGYAFARIQRDSRRIVDSLVRTGQPFAIPPDPLRYRFYDSVVLDVFAKEPELGRPILASIFARNPVQRVLRFLDDNSSCGRICRSCARRRRLRLNGTFPPGGGEEHP
jgi:lycopene beta-cyclase